VNIDDRLRAASRALKDSSVAQVDAASRLREIVRRTGQPVIHGRTAVLPDQAWEPELPEAALVPPAPPRRGPQRLALVLNLLLVLGIGVLLGVGAGYVLDTDSTAPASSASTAPASSASAIATGPARTQVPAACVDAADLADEVISRLNRNERDNRLAAALRQYTIASRDCRRAATP
jgi:hypothetical protein